LNGEKIGPPKDLQVSFEEMSWILRQAMIGEFKITTDRSCTCGFWEEFKKSSSPLLSGETK